MNMKKILFICLIICFVCSIHAVAAADVDVNATDDGILTDQSIDTVNNEYATEVMVYQTALRNMANTYNDYISQFSNFLYTKIFSITQFDCEENVQQENIILTRTK